MDNNSSYSTVYDNVQEHHRYRNEFWNFRSHNYHHHWYGSATSSANQNLTAAYPSIFNFNYSPNNYSNILQFQENNFQSNSKTNSDNNWLEEAKAATATLSPETIKDLEQFADSFKQRRIKLGFTQADVGRDIAQMNVSGMGSLSQSTICRFESLTLSHNNMLALKPLLEQWLLQAELDHEIKINAGLTENKRRRTSIANTERRSLEAYFAVQNRPSSDKITEIALSLGLKKSVVRVWFCNQRQKQKRLKCNPHKFSTRSFHGRNINIRSSTLVNVTSPTEEADNIKSDLNDSNEQR